MSLSVPFYALKVLNAVLAAVWSVGLTYTFLRTLGVDAYAVLAFTMAVGGFVLIFDFGLSNVVYRHYRTLFLANEPVDPSALVAAIGLAALICVAALAVFGAVLLWQPSSSVSAGALGLVFLSVVLPLPSMPMRATLGALDHYRFAESVEALRRMGMIALAASVLSGTSILGYGIGALVLWAALFAAYGLALRRLLRGRPWVDRAALRTVAAPLAEQLRQTAGYTVSEFAIYNMPYVVLPILTGQARDVVAFDTFSKCIRLAALAYAAGTEAALPHLTQLYHRGQRAALAKAMRRVLIVNALPFAVATAVMVLAGRAIFASLLGDETLMTPVLRGLVIAMAAAMLLQSSAGPVLMAIGAFRPLALCAESVLALLLLGASLAFGFAGSLQAFMFLYVAVFAGGSAAHAVLLQRINSAPEPQKPYAHN